MFNDITHTHTCPNALAGYSLLTHFSDKAVNLENFTCALGVLWTSVPHEDEVEGEYIR